MTNVGQTPQKPQECVHLVHIVDPGHLKEVPGMESAHGTASIVWLRGSHVTTNSLAICVKLVSSVKKKLVEVKYAKFAALQFCEATML